MDFTSRKLDFSLTLRCLDPFELPDYPGIPIRCRRCPACLDQRRLEWKNRMLLESYGRNYRPILTTWTFKQSHYLDSPRYVLDELQKLYKRLRRDGSDLRYFTAMERGKKGRLHAHSVIWSERLSNIPWWDLVRYLSRKWNNGAVNVKFIDSPGAFSYTAKYLVKDLSEHVDRGTGEVRSCRTYTWSNNPRLGDPGLKRWEYLVKKMDSQIPSNWFHMPFQGKLVKAYVPSRNYMMEVKNLTSNSALTDDTFNLSGIDFDSILLSWLEDQKDANRITT